MSMVLLLDTEMNHNCDQEILDSYLESRERYNWITENDNIFFNSQTSIKREVLIVFIAKVIASAYKYIDPSTDKSYISYTSVLCNASFI